MDAASPKPIPAYDVFPPPASRQNYGELSGKPSGGVMGIGGRLDRIGACLYPVTQHARPAAS
jgi:hypothetical protein